MEGGGVWKRKRNAGTLSFKYVVRERYLRPDTSENMGSPEFTEVLELFKDRVYDDTNMASAAKTSACQSFDGGPPSNGCGGGNRDSFKNARPAREMAAPRTTFAMDVTKDSDFGNIIRNGGRNAVFDVSVLLPW
eukprot:jgi/Tetstr1/458960/TSEL_004431.t1